MRVDGFGKQGGGFHSFENGHLLAWANWPNPEDRPNWEQRSKWAAQFGEARADWMVGRLRNLCLYPNVYLQNDAKCRRKFSLLPPSGAPIASLLPEPCLGCLTI
jgi:hypothetical protein